LGERNVRKIVAIGDTKVIIPDNEKDTIFVEGDDLNAVSGTCALIH
jgi:ribosomal protein L6P/L9E